MVGYEEGEDWVISKMKTGYPRFFIHLTIQELERELLQLYGRHGEKVMLFPSQATARRCQQFFYDKISVQPGDVHLLHLEPVISKFQVQQGQTVFSGLHCCFFPGEYFSTAKQVWQHSGDGVSSRRGEFCLKALREGLLRPVSNGQDSPPQNNIRKGPRRYRTNHGSLDGIDYNVNGHHKSTLNGSANTDDKDCTSFVEERFGRNLNAELAFKAKLAIKRRISGCLIDNSDLDVALSKSPEGCDRRLKGLSEEDVYLYPTGMSSIFNAHRTLLALARSEGREPEQSICFGFPYIDTLKVLEKWGPGCLFYGNGTDADLDDLERRLESGERFLSLFTEFPSNPLLRSPNLARIRTLATKYSFAIVVDETVGNFININVLSQADVVVSSLTKVFSGDSNVMGGSAVLNPHSRLYPSLKKINEIEYEDNFWAEDAVFLERNSRDFISRIERTNFNAEAITSTLQACPIVKAVYYPTLVPSKVHYDACRTPNGGYGGLLSVTFQQPEQAVAFFDALEVQKGPSLGTNFTLACPYTILAHYLEIEWTTQFGVEPDLVRLSVGLEDVNEIVRVVKNALDAAMSI